MNDQNPLPAPGWYADPASPDAALRYWDGATWTEHTHPLEAAGSAGSAAAADAGAGTGPVAPDAGRDAAATAPSAPDTEVPSAEVPNAEVPNAPASSAEVPGADERDAEPVPPVESAPEQRPNPYAADQAQTPLAASRPDPYAAAPQQSNPYAAAPQQPNPYAHPTHQAGGPGAQHPAPPTAPWAQGPGNPYQSPQAAQVGAPAAATTSRKGLWIGLGIGGGVFLLLVIGIIVAVSAFFSAISSGLAGQQDPDFGQGGPGPGPLAGEVPSTTTPSIAGDPLAIGDPVNYTSEYSPAISWELVLTEYLGDITDESAALYGGEVVAATAQITNTGTQPADPYTDLDAVFLTADGTAYDDWWYVEPGLIDLNTIEPGETVEFTFSFEIPAGAAEGGSIVITDYYVENGVEVRLD